MRHVADTGLCILYQLLQNVDHVDTAAQSFYQTYYIDILQHLFSVVTDSSHTAGLSLHFSFICTYRFIANISLCTAAATNYCWITARWSARLLCAIIKEVTQYYCFIFSIIFLVGYVCRIRLTMC